MVSWANNYVNSTLLSINIIKTAMIFTCGRPLSPAACSFSFINATFAAVALFFAPLRPLLLVTFFDSV